MGLCHGMGGSGGTCGILTGGCLALGLYIGKGRDEETPFEQGDALVGDFVDWFTERVQDDYGATTCAAIINDGKPDPACLQAARYFDGMNFATRAKAEAIFSVGFIDLALADAVAIVHSTAEILDRCERPRS